MEMRTVRISHSRDNGTITPQMPTAPMRRTVIPWLSSPKLNPSFFTMLSLPIRCLPHHGRVIDVER
jgi:hypothetical protein